jgi:hypothetical protein
MNVLFKPNLTKEFACDITKTAADVIKSNGGYTLCTTENAKAIGYDFSETGDFFTLIKNIH